VRDAAGVYVVKLGGSLITNRDTVGGFDRERSDRLARCVASRLAAGPTDLILVLGGGSFAHPIVAGHGISRAGAHADPSRLFELPVHLFRLKHLFIESLCKHGVTALPFETLSYLTTVRSAINAAFLAPIRTTLGLGYVPVLSGGLVADLELGVRPVSSDRIPVVVSQGFHLRRFISLTDQPGIVREPGSGEIFRTVSRQDYHQVSAAISPPVRVDVTDGMRGKLDAALELARLGVQSVIADGRDLDEASFAELFEAAPRGTVVEPWSDPA
jgi:isopentenyl phosphate kinase